MRKIFRVAQDQADNWKKGTDTMDAFHQSQLAGVAQSRGELKYPADIN
jgi:hypothetical protein